MKLLLTRHAQTKENECGLLQGPTTGNFTVEGERQLKFLAKRIRKLEFDIVLSSDLRRCVKTAEFLFSKSSKIRLLPIIREKNNGDFVGKKAKDIDWDALPGTFETRKLLGGESLEDVRNRALSFLSTLENEKAETILVIGHGAFLKIFIGIILGFDLRRSIFGLQIDHCSLTTIEIKDDKTTKIISLNDVGYLEQP